MQVGLAVVLFFTAAIFGWGRPVEDPPQSTNAPATSAAQDPAPAKTVAPAKPMSPLSWLIGGVWTADASRIGPGMLRVETRYQWADNNAFIRFNTHFVSDKGADHTYDGQCFWDPNRKGFYMWYMDSQNSIVEGSVTVQGDVTTFTFRAPDFDGKMADLRALVTRKNNDDYNWTLQEMQGASWKDLATLEYLRVAGS
jgi:hypothetical protein